jgi:hypothetical protein
MLLLLPGLALAASVSNSELIAESGAVLERSKIDYTKGDYSTDSSNIFDDFSANVKNGLVLPSLEFDPSKPPIFSISTSFSSKSRSVDIRNSPTGYSDLEFENSKASETRKRSLLEYSCSNNIKSQRSQSQNQLNANFPTLNLENIVDDIVKSLTTSENNIKRSITNAVSSNFANMSQYLRPEYLLEKTLDFASSKISQAQCDICKETKVGCNQVFLIAEIYEDGAVKAKVDEMIKSIASRKESQKETGSYLDYDFFPGGCPTSELIRGPSGVGRSIGISTYTETSAKIKEAVESTGKSVQDTAYSICFKSKKTENKDWILNKIKKYSQSIKLHVESTEKCKEENKDPLAILEKSQRKKIDVVKSLDETFSINGLVNKLNKASQTQHKSIIDTLNSYTAGIRAVDNTPPAELDEVITSTNTTTRIPVELDSRFEFAINNIKNKGFNPSLQDALIESLYDLYNVFHLSDFYLKKAKDIMLNIVTTGTNQDSSQEYIRESVNNFKRDLIDHESEAISVMVASKLREDTKLICNSFISSGTLTQKDCFLDAHLSSISSIYTPDFTCQCESTTYTHNIFPNIFVFISGVIKSIEEPFENQSPKETYKDSIASKLRELEIDYLRSIATNLSAIQATANFTMRDSTIKEKDVFKEVLIESIYILR